MRRNFVPRVRARENDLYDICRDLALSKMILIIVYTRRRDLSLKIDSLDQRPNRSTDLGKSVDRQIQAGIPDNFGNIGRPISANRSTDSCCYCSFA